MTVEYARRVAQAVLARLGEATRAWEVRDVAPAGESVPAPAGTSTARHLLITIGAAAGDPDTLGVYFTEGLPRDQATVATAEQIQDHAIEYTHGDPLPPCPGHRHPMTARSVDGVASWVCPLGPEHHTEPIVP